ncbi:fatty acid cis/trans isomerase [Colwellia echini]|uniref:Peptidylprolyl isomerase n=1 Tax=Colwellia echini TaxID=1982103 RepID=A0ABY3MWX9_9GAMM|nr:fatty acid cis/trans isomerase [Colwellia echini]TYK65733.1 peptidylprolyl isomerase [Colwellia echini]
MNLRFIVIALIAITIVVIAASQYVSPAAKPLLADSALVIQTDTLVSYSRDIQPILEQRCVVCHACYDAPCQLKLGSFEGLTRGANKEPVYNGERLLQANLTRLFEDGHTVPEWREKDFFPVIPDKVTELSEITSDAQQNQQSNNLKSNLKSNVMANMLLLKQANPLPANDKLPEEFNFALNEEYQCSTAAEFDDYQVDYPLHGMPYGLPAVNNKEHQLLIDWLAQGATNSEPKVIDKETQEQINNWESFLNQNSKKAQLMSRYLFEHLFLVHLYFDKAETTQFFKLVRSATPPGQPVKGIFTRRPFDDPKVERVYYRIQPVVESIAHKSHLPIKLDSPRMERWSTWFLETPNEVTQLPSYELDKASNPFITFEQIPVQSRYRYLLDEAQNTIMQFIKGPVCRGNIALNVINDHFWVVFMSPDLDFIENNDQFMQQARQKIVLPAEDQSNALPTSWLEYAAMEKDYLLAKSKFIDKKIKNHVDINLDLLWDGDGENDNATLTIFRHNDSASVVKGLVGDKPQTTWVLSYSLFERIHYLLVAGYDVYGNVGHQLNSRVYMDFLRMEGEFNFLNFLPVASREKVRGHWYRGSVSEVEQYLYDANQTTIESDINYQTNEPLNELYEKLRQYFSKVSNKGYALTSGINNKKTIAALKEINGIVGKSLSSIPNSSIVRIVDVNSQESEFYTLIRNNVFSNISHLFEEEDRRLREEDTVIIAPGLITSYPNAFFSVTTDELSDFADKLSKMRSEQDYQQLRKKYAVYRSSENFWQYTDAMHSYFKQRDSIQFGVLDFNRLENR